MSTKQQQSTFPSKLYTLLSDDSISDTICWLPHGKSWKILRPSKLADDILPRYFPKLKYASFRRQVNAWGFSRITEGHSQGSYFHKFFMKDRPELVSHIQRPPTAAAKRKNSLQKKNKNNDKENDKTTSICTTSVVSTSSDEEGSTTSSSSKQQQQQQQQPDRRTSEVEFKAMLSNVEGGHGQQQEEVEPCMPVLPKCDFRQTTQTSDVELLSFLSTVMKSMNDDGNGKGSGSGSGNEDLMSTGSSSSSMSSISSCSSLGVPPPPPPLNVPSSFFTSTTTMTTGREGQQDIHMVVNESQKEFLCMIQRQKQEINRMLETHSKEMAEYCYAKKHRRDNGNADNDNDNENMSHQGMVSHERNTKEILRNQFCFLSEIEKTVEISSSLALAQQQQDEMMMMI